MQRKNVMPPEENDSYGEKTTRTMPPYWKQVWSLASQSSLISQALVTMLTYGYIDKFKADVLDTRL